jgi:two-component system CheB/CheR fusion protein
MSSKEEMQSLNEELQTLNSELQSKVDDFSRVNNDMKNLLNSTEIATLFLDSKLNIRRYTSQAVKIFKLIKSDVGRPFTDLVSDLIYPDLAEDALSVLKSLIFIKKQVPTKDGRWFSIRIMPYRTLNDRIDGVVITFFNISDLKEAEVKLHETEQLNNLLLKSSSDIIIKLTKDFKFVEINPSAEIYLGKKQEELMSKNFIDVFIPKSQREKTKIDLNRIMSDSHDTSFTLQMKTAGEKLVEAQWSLIVLLDDLKMPSGMILSIKNI